MNLLIKGGKVVFGGETTEKDILVKGDTIAAVGAGLEDREAEVIDARGKYVLPGAIDVHTHMQLPFGGTVSADDFANGTKAAAFGGVTTIIDFAIQAKGAEFLASGRALIVSFVQGIQSVISRPAEVVREGLANLRRLHVPTSEDFPVLLTTGTAYLVEHARVSWTTYRPCSAFSLHLYLAQLSSV
ncbi:MAG: amidohydrolase family protein, partial [Peptococcaceae bacterium]|nr:amidohydrolase family protein [Peptococcaceae bacterium]